MFSGDAGELVFPVLCIGLGGLALGAAGLWMESRLANARVRAIALIVGISLTALAATLGLLQFSAAEWVSIGVLGIACLIAAAAHWRALGRAAARLLQPRAVWGLLLVGGPVFAWSAALHLNDPDPLPPLVEALPIDRIEVADQCGMTDQGHCIPLYNLAVPQSAEEYEAEYVAENDLACRVIRTGDLDPTYNCHGWVFTGGRYALRSEDIEQILADNHYRQIEDPLPGDLIIYRSADGAIQHTGLVRSLLDGGVVLVESKWGPLGRYLHTPDAQPYGTDYAFYRSPRHGHLLSLVDAPAHQDRPRPKPQPHA